MNTGKPTCCLSETDPQQIDITRGYTKLTRSRGKRGTVKDKGTTEEAGPWLPGMASAAIGWPQSERQGRRPRGRRSRPQRWNDAVQTLIDLQAEYQVWLADLPLSRRCSPVAQQVEKISAFRLDKLRVEVKPSHGSADAPEAATGPSEPSLPF